MMMRYSRIGASDLQVSRVCLGSMTWGEQNSEEEAHAQLDYAFSRGVNFVDTAELYPVPPKKETQGRTERFIGSWLAKKGKEFRGKVIIATKVAGYAPGRAYIPANREEHGKEMPCRLDKNSILKACDGSLRRLQTDYIDLYQLHWPDRYVPGFGTSAYDADKEREDVVSFEETVSAIGELLKNGKIRYWGLSNETSYGVCQFIKACEALKVPFPISIQNSYSLLHRSFEADLAECCTPRNFNIGLLPWSPLAGGVLTGKYLPELNEATEKDVSKSWRFNKFPQFQGRFTNTRSSNAVAKYAEVAKEFGISLTTMSLAFMNSKPFVSSTIIGATTMEQLAEDIDALTMDLSPECLARINEIYLDHRDPCLLD